MSESSESKYLRYRVMLDGLPAGLSILAENKKEAGRKLAIASNRLDFGIGDVDLELAS